MSTYLEYIIEKEKDRENEKVGDLQSGSSSISGYVSVVLFVAVRTGVHTWPKYSSYRYDQNQILHLDT